MSADWPEFQLGDRCTVKSSRRIFAHEYVEKGIPFMRSKDVIDKALGSFVDYDLYISEDRFSEIKKTHGYPVRGDLLISSVGNRSGQPYVIQDEGEFHFKDGNILWLSEFKNINSDYLAYWLKSEIGQDALTSVMIGSAQKALTIDSIRKLWVSFPPLDYQDWAVELLLSLDKKIAINRQINQTLEQMAQAIFKSWFVDFDPVRAKMEGRDTGLPKHIADLFSDELVESELGLVPKGWLIKKLEDKFLPKKGKNITKDTITEGDVPVVAGGLSPAYYHNTHNVAGPVITVSASGANAGFVNLYHQNIWASDCSYINSDIDSHVYSLYLFLKCRQEEITKMQQGAAQPHVYPKDLARLVLVDPPTEIWGQLEVLTTPFFMNIKNNIDQIKILEAMRDSLLPKLLSGEIEVGEVSA